MCNPAECADTSQVKSLSQLYSDELDVRVKKKVFWIVESYKYCFENHYSDIQQNRYPSFSLCSVPYDRNVPNNLYIWFVYITASVSY